MNPPSQPALQTRPFQSWRWIFLATILIVTVAITISTFYFATVQAESHGAITGLTLTSDTPGTLTASWDAASPTPTDYRVDWAKSDEDYQSWKVDDGHVYPAPTATAVTIANLEHNTEYKIRMRARYYRGEHEGKSWGGPWATKTITVAGEAVETPTPEPAEEEPVEEEPVEEEPAEEEPVEEEPVEEEPVEEEPVKKEPGQRPARGEPTRDDPARDDPARDDPAPEDTTPAAGTIETLTADDAAGQLLLTWQAPAAPNADPTDYHVNWGKSAEDYPADTAEAGNAHPDSTTHTLAGLEYDTEYNIRVRARYSDGENADSPWNGPWTETTAQVKLPLPAAPRFINTAVTEGQVLLSWFKPSDESITGYQILRGPDASNLVVIEDDTGSSSTSYTDETPPAGQTHTYGVKARNASGLSPAGTAAVAVPEVLIVARHGSTGNTLVSNLGQTFSAEGAIAGIHQERYKEHAIAFTTGANPLGYHITTAQLTVKEFPGKDTPNPDVSIRADNRGVPGETVLYTLTATSAVTDSWNLLTFTTTTTDNFTLRPNTTYWLYATAMGTNTMLIRGTESDVEDTESNTDWRIGDARYSRDNGGTWTQWDDFNLFMKISGHAAPEFLVSNLDSPGEDTVFGRRTDADVSKFAQSFSAADNTDGTPAEFDFHGITILLESDLSGQLADSDIVVTVHKDSGGQPGDLVYTLTSPATYTVQPDTHPVTFLAPPGSTLSSGITYWVKFEIAAASTFFTEAKYIYFKLATDDNEVQGPTTYNRWSIGDDSLWSPETLSWMDDSQSIQMSVLGAPHYDTLVSNIDQPFLGRQPIGPGDKAAQSFMTPPGPLGQQYPLHRVHINAASQYPTQTTVDLHTDNDGAPGDHLASMSMPGDFAPGEFTPADLITVAPAHTNLNPETRYWIVISNEQEFNALRISVTKSKVEDSTSLNGWEIDNQKARTRPDNSWALLAAPIQMAILGSPPFIRTDESDGPDLPGAGHNAHRTGAVVTPGIVSTGHLTPGLDRNHGLYGDYWWLDTKTGHRYRIEVKFGDSQNNDTGGSAWMSFIDPDHDDYPYASGCCEADHNRDDGHTFVHFRRPTDDWNNRYLVHIAAFDKLNHNSNIYNGPYTITMTDITGTEKVATNLYLGTRATTHLPVSNGNVKFAVSFTTGDHPGGYYKLDRVRMHVPRHEGKPELTLHVNTSGLPGDGICDLLKPNKVQHHRPYAADNHLPVPFRAAHCGRDAVLAANTTYWLVLGGSDYFPALTDSDDQQTSRSGWTIGDVAAIKAIGSWRNNNNGTIPVEIWASPTPPPNRHATGVPLVHGERRVGETLTADITGITDPEGLSDPRFTYSWIRGDGVDEKSIAGEESETYTLKDDDAGQRIKTLVTFLDNEEWRETAVGPATSIITPDPRVLVSNTAKSTGTSTNENYSSAFITGPHEQGYSIDTVRMQRNKDTATTVPNGQTEYRLYSSVGTENPIFAYPRDLLMTASPPEEVRGEWLTFKASSKVKLRPNTPYQNALSSKTDSYVGCVIANNGVDSNSLAGFSISPRIHQLGSPTQVIANACTFEVKGFELTASPFVGKVEITSTPTLEGMYETGETIEVTAELTETVTFTEPPLMLLQVGDNEREMVYMPSASTGTSWVFQYTVTAIDRDDDGVSLERNAIRGYADADLSHRGITNDREHHVNAVPQIVSRRVSSKPLVPNWYGTTEQIEFTLEFSLPVKVVGFPQLEFNVNTPAPDNEFALFNRGSGTKELVFSYTVGTDDDDPDGISWNENSLRLDSDASITSTFNNLDANLDHTELGKLESHRIDQNPRAISQEITSEPTDGTNSDTYGAGDMITFQIVFNQQVIVNGVPRLRFSISSGADDEYATYVSGATGNTVTFSYTVLTADADTDGIHLYTDPLDYPDPADDSILSIYNDLPAENSGIGKAGALSGHKVDGSLTN